jgi:signal transduction histidine kinase
MAEYNYLPPGQYTFRVVACNNDEVWSPNGAALPFVVLPYFWQTAWFRGLEIGTGASALTAGILWVGRRRLRRELERSERQRVVERERARIARDMHDELGASLTRISLLSESVRDELAAEPNAASEDAAEAYRTAREAIRAMDEIVWAVNPAHDTLDSLVGYLGRYAERYFATAGVDCRLDVPLQVPRWTLGAEVRHNVFLAFKEGLHNIVKHARASEVRITVTIGPSGFVVEVADNGRGFSGMSGPTAPSPSADLTRPAGGNGLMNMRQRMEEIGGTCAWDTAPGHGTRLKLSFGNLS